MLLREKSCPSPFYLLFLTLPQGLCTHFCFCLFTSVPSWGKVILLPSHHFILHIVFAALVMIWSSYLLFYSFVVLSPASSENGGWLCFVHSCVSTFQAMPSSWYRPLTNIYWMNKWMKLKRIEVKYQRLKIKWPCLCVFLNPEVLTCILFHSGILFNMNYGNRFLRASCFLVPLKTWC